MTEAAQFLGISARTLRLAVERGTIEAQHPLAEGPWVFNRQALVTSAAVQLVEGARRRGGNPAVPDIRQATLDFSKT